MILLDESNLMVAACICNGPSIVVENARAAYLSSILAIKRRFGQRIIVCRDSERSWRKDVFPHYKANRKKTKDKEFMEMLHGTMNVLREETQEHLPYSVIQVPRAEADDIIAVATERLGSFDREQTNIVSTDTDMHQLHRFPNVWSWDNIRKMAIRVADPDDVLLRHIIGGDPGDGIPNILSPSDTFAAGKRQTPMTVKRMMEINDRITLPGGSPDGAPWSDRFRENERLIDLRKIPTELKESIVKVVDGTIANPPKRTSVFAYLADRGVRTLMPKANEF